MKLIDKYIFKAFLRPFVSTFLIAMFILVLQVIWLLFDDLAGKGLTLGILLKFVFYVIVTMLPRAVPIATLLASIMTLGQLSEKYEFAAIKSSGISLMRLIRPLLFFVIILSFINFLFLNNAYPWAVLKQKNLYSNIKKKQPALALVEGTFNTDIKGYTLKFDKKYGPENNLLDNVLIYQTNQNGSVNTITAKKGEISSKEGSKYLNLKLNDGYYYQEHAHRGSPKKERERMPFSKSHFETYTVNLDISEFSLEDIEDVKYKQDREMLSLDQLKIYSDSLKPTWDNYIVHRATRTIAKLKPKKETDSTKQSSIIYPILDNFEEAEQLNILENTKVSIDNTIQDFENFRTDYKYKRKRLNLIDTEYHYRIALSLSALLLFLIGAPLGALIRKGGFGLPMVFAIVIYLVYHFTSSFTRNMAEESSISDILGGWLPTLSFLPFALYLLISTSTDRGKINFTSLIQHVTKWLKSLTNKSKRKAI